MNSPSTDPTFGSAPLHAMHVVPRPEMAGAKLAVRVGGTLYVSPAMWDLLRHADAAELIRLAVDIRSLDFTHAAPLFGAGKRIPFLALTAAGVPPCSTASSTAPNSSPPPSG